MSRLPRGGIDEIAPQAYNLIGYRSGRLVVKSLAGRTEDGKILWNCDCDCGGSKVVRGQSLVRSTLPTRSCGCIARELRRVQHGARRSAREVVEDRAVCRYIESANGRGIEFSISKKEALDLLLSNCHYCGAEPSMERGKSKNGEVILMNGIDRLDSSIGYVPGNVVACCKKDNFSKLNQLPEEYEDQCRRVVAHGLSRSAPSDLAWSVQ